jgi:hypothetical protein
MASMTSCGGMRWLPMKEDSLARGQLIDWREQTAVSHWLGFASKKTSVYLACSKLSMVIEIDWRKVERACAVNVVVVSVYGKSAM